MSEKKRFEILFEVKSADLMCHNLVKYNQQSFQFFYPILFEVIGHTQYLTTHKIYMNI